MKRDIKFLFETYRPYWHLILVAVIGSLLESGALAGLAYIIKNVVDDVFVAKSYEKLVFVISVLIGLAAAKQIGFFLKDFVYPLVIYKALRVLREKIYKRIIHAKPSFFRKVQPGDLISRATTDTERFGEISATIGTNVITESFTVIGIVAVLIYRDWKMFLIFLFAVPFLALSLNYFGEKRKKYSKKLQESFSQYIQHLNQILSGIEVVKLFKEKIFLKLFHRINENLYVRQKKNRLYETVYLSSVEIIAYMATAGIIFYGGSRIIKGEITPGDFFSFLGGVLILVNSLQVLQRGAVNLKALSPVIDRILFVLNIPQEEEKGIVFEGLKKEIQYRNLSLKIGETQILKNINLKIKKGEKIGIVGLTGSGKSTLVKILPALITDYQGEVLGVVGSNATGKSTFVKVLAGVVEDDDGKVNLDVKVSYKPQYVKADVDMQVGMFLRKINPMIDSSYYKTEFLKPLMLESLLDRYLDDLSGGELQRVAVVACLLREADLTFSMSRQPTSTLSRGLRLRE